MSDGVAAPANIGPACKAAAGVDPERRLAELARSRGALRRVIAALAAALVGREPAGGPGPGGWERLGYVRAGDYARERLGLSARSLHDLARVGRALAGLPRLEAALVSGALPWSKARLLARFATADDEACWIGLARSLSVRELERRVRAVDRGALGAVAPAEGELGRDDLDCDEDGNGTEPLETVQVRVGSALCFKWQHARTWAARVAGEPVSPGAALEMITAEAISALPPIADTDLPPDAAGSPFGTEPCGSRSRLPHPAGGAASAHGEPAAADVCATQNAAPAEGSAELPLPGLPAFLRPLLLGLEEADPFELDARLRRAVRLEQRLDAEVAALLRRVTSSEYAWRTRPRTLAVFAREWLGMSPRRARALVRLERLGEVCPELRAAWRDGAISWVQAQILVPLLIGGGDDAEQPGWRAVWLDFARRVTVRRLDEAVGRALVLREADPRHWLLCREEPERAAAGEAGAPPERQTCARPRDAIEGIRLRVSAPREVARLFHAVLCSLRRAVEAEIGRLPGEDQVFEAMIDHALRSWGVERPRVRGLAVFDRDGWRCTIPGCTSQRNLHAHHIRFRSAGGSNDAANLTTLCAAHHHRGVHAGLIRVGGCAPDGLWFELGVREGRPPLARYRSGDRVA